VVPPAPHEIERIGRKSFYNGLIFT